MSHEAVRKFISFSLIFIVKQNTNDDDDDNDNDDNTVCLRYLFICIVFKSTRTACLLVAGSQAFISWMFRGFKLNRT